MTDDIFNSLVDFTVAGNCYIPLNKDTKEQFEIILESSGVKCAEYEKVLVPLGPRAQDLLSESVEGEVIDFNECTARDLNFHKQYFVFLTSIWEEMPANFKKWVQSNVFYKWLKHLKKNYKVLYRFRDEDKHKWIVDVLTAKKSELRLSKKQIEAIASLTDRTDLVEYESISFGRMTEKKFEQYVRDQIPWIYSEVVERFYKDDALDEKIKKIEDKFRKFFKKLESL
jgi:hypothetical protein